MTFPTWPLLAPPVHLDLQTLNSFSLWVPFQLYLSPHSGQCPALGIPGCLLFSAPPFLTAELLDRAASPGCLNFLAF